MTQSVPPLFRRLAAEGLGTGILVATVVGSGIMAERLAGGNQAIALIGNTIPTGAILVVLITILGPVSGAHFNPAVTLVFATRDRAWRDVVPYIVVQCLGGIAGTALAHLMFELPPIVIGTTARSGPSQWLAEGVATFCADPHHSRRGAICASGNSLARRTGDHGGLLVHGLDLVCQPRRDAGARVYHDVFGDRPAPCPGLRRSPVRRRGRRSSGVGGVVCAGDRGQAGCIHVTTLARAAAFAGDDA